MKCEVCGATGDGYFFSIAVSSAEDAEDEDHYLCVRHYSRWLRWHNYRRWLAKMCTEVTHG